MNHRTAANGRFEFLGMPDDPCRHKTTIGTTGDRDALFIDPFMTAQRTLPHGKDIFIVAFAPFFGNYSRKFFDIPSVSYTHLRAHETRHDLVCRLLLEKK